MAEFKKLSDVEVAAEPMESANVLIEENGVIKKTPKTAVGGSIVLNCSYDTEAGKFTSVPTFNFDELKTAVMNGTLVILVVDDAYYYNDSGIKRSDIYHPTRVHESYIKFINFDTSGGYINIDSDNNVNMFTK